MTQSLVKKIPAERVVELRVVKNKVAVMCNGRNLAYFDVPDVLEMIYGFLPCFNRRKKNVKR